MLYPQTNSCRTVVDLSGLWQCAFDFEDKGEADGWHARVPTGVRPIAVPGSWNEQVQDTRDYLDTAWCVRFLACRKAGMAIPSASA